MTQQQSNLDRQLHDVFGHSAEAFDTNLDYREAERAKARGVIGSLALLVTNDERADQWQAAFEKRVATWRGKLRGKWSDLKENWRQERHTERQQKEDNGSLASIGFGPKDVEPPIPVSVWSELDHQQPLTPPHTVGEHAERHQKDWTALDAQTQELQILNAQHEPTPKAPITVTETNLARTRSADALDLARAALARSRAQLDTGNLPTMTLRHINPRKDDKEPQHQ